MSNGFDVRGRALHDGELAAWLAEHSLGNRFGVSVVGTDGAHGRRAVALAIVAADGDGRYLDVAALAADDEAALVSWLADPGPPKALHDAKSAARALAGSGWTLCGVTSDTALAAYLLRPERAGLSLDDLLIAHMRCALPPEAGEQRDYSAQALILRACAVLDLADVLDEELARIDSSSLLSRLELPVQGVLAEMEITGIAVDRGSRAPVGDLMNSAGSDGRIHATFHQTAAASGRISSSGPDLHDGPIDRDMFVAGDGYAGLMTAGYCGLESAVTAHLAADVGLVDDARRLGYAATLLGRRRYLPGLDSADRRIREVAEQAAVSFAIEGSAADLMKAALISVDWALKEAGLKSRIVMQAGDGLVFEVAAGEREVVAACAREQLGDACPLDVPLEVSVGFGTSWGDAIP